MPNARHGNHSGIGNTLEDLLGISENNLSIPNAAEWELKTQRSPTSALTTIFHLEPSPRAIKFVPGVLLPKYGWAHQGAGTHYPETEMSFRQTIHGLSRSDRGFKVVVDESERKVLISFDAGAVDIRHADWLKSVKKRVGSGELDPQPYWGFEEGKEFYHYQKISMLANFSLEKFLAGLQSGHVLIDFDARTGHNHGAKFRLRQELLPTLYETVTEV